MNREKTADPFNTSDQEDIISDLTGNKAISIARNKTANTPSNKTIKQYTKLKATFSLSQSVLDLLEDAWIELRRDPNSRRITKTTIVESSLEILLLELKNKGDKSQLYSNLVKNKAIKQ